MATIDVRRAHALPKEEAKKRAEELAKGDAAEVRAYSGDWEGDHIRFEAPRGAAKGTTGTVEVGDKEVRVQIDLPFLLRMLKGKVESKVNEKLDQLLLSESDATRSRAAGRPCGQALPDR